MGAIYKRELKAYFISPVGYVFMGVFLLVSGVAFAASTLFASTSSTSVYFTYLLFSFIVLIPLLTMRLLSEERKTRTDQLLLTAPVSLHAVVLSKFFAAFTLFVLTLGLSCLNFLTILPYGTLSGALVLSQLAGLILIGGAFCAIGLFLSALTENQLISAILSIGAIFALLGVGLITPNVQNETLRVVLKWISIFDRYYTFGYGQFDFVSVFYYLSVAVIFLFLTVRVMEKRRWA